MLHRATGAAILALAGCPLLSQGGPRNVSLGGVRELAVQARVYRWNEEAGAFIPRSDLPPLYWSQSERVKDITWDGEWAYRVVDHAGVLELQHGLALATPTGPCWFWRPGVRLAPGSEVVVASGRRAVIRVEKPATEGQAREFGKVHLNLLDLVEGSEIPLDEQTGVPDRLSVVGCIIDGTIHCFWATGKVLKLSADSRNPDVEVENFWNGLPIQPAPTVTQFMGYRIYSPPAWLRKPAITADGKVVLGSAVRRKVPEEVAIPMATEIFRVSNSEFRQRMIDQGAFPITEEAKQRFNLEVNLMLEWDPLNRTMKLAEPGRWEHLAQDIPLPEGVKSPPLPGYKVIKNKPVAFQVAADGRIQSLESLLMEALPRLKEGSRLAEPAKEAEAARPRKRSHD